LGAPVGSHHHLAVAVAASPPPDLIRWTRQSSDPEMAGSSPIGVNIRDSHSGLSVIQALDGTRSIRFG
jgi:hypothetical protein